MSNLSNEMEALAKENKIVPEQVVKKRRKDAQSEAIKQLQNITPEAEATEEEVEEEEVVVASATAKKAPRSRSRKIISIDGVLATETPESKKRAALLDLTESLKAGKILTGKISGVENLNSRITAVLYHGDIFKVIIPVEECIEIPERFLSNTTGKVRESKISYALNMRVGTEIDYIVLGVDNENEIIVASRLKAMEKKARDYYIKTDRQGRPIMYEGAIAEARIVAVNQKGITVEVMGVETFIKHDELSYQRIQDATLKYFPGDRINVKITKIDIQGNKKKDGYMVTIQASVKQTGPHPYDKYSSRYMLESIYSGKVTMVTEYGIFVNLNGGGLDVLCKFPERGPRPVREATATVRITAKNDEMKRMFGIITHIVPPSR